MLFLFRVQTPQNQARVVDYDRTQEILVASGLRAGGRYGFSKVSLLDDGRMRLVGMLGALSAGGMCVRAPALMPLPRPTGRRE